MAIFSVRAGGFLEHLLRLAALLVVLGLVVVGFWKNSERNIERINARFGLSDETKTLSQAEQEQIQGFITALRKTYGIEARVQVRQGALDPPEQDGKTLFVGLSLDKKSAVVLLPPLMERALGADFAQSLTREHFPFHFGPGKSWRRGLLLALELIQSRLAELSVPAAPAERTSTEQANATHTNATQKDHP
ncbi:MAG: hypothetical protein CVU73_10840 [Deltaproteobacteria bacterium HGW-Deltaproteobacteria-8]|jgi:hypothetical protein|nr:MAG: hypothetical protein CVU73_10840 [Deltaproteobacteria bacterium HGW-Deltaproteobacteria-8]